MKWWIECGDENDFGSGDCGIDGGDSNAKFIKITAFLSLPLHPINNTPNNQSKPIVPTPSLSLL